MHVAALHLVEPLYLLSGFLVGLLVGLTGVGGGSLMTPLLVLLFGVHPTTAVGTDLLFAAATKTVGTAVHGANRAVDWRVVGRLATGSVPATALTLLVIALVGSHGARTNATLSLLLGAMLLVTATSVLFRARLIDWAGRRFHTPSPRTIRLATIAMGFALGVLVSVSSVGAGAIGVTALILLYREMPIARVVATDIAHAVPLTLIAGTGHWWLGNVNAHLLASLLTGSIPGVVAGSLLVRRVSERVLRPALALVLVLVGIRMLAA